MGCGRVDFNGNRKAFQMRRLDLRVFFAILVFQVILFTSSPLWAQAVDARPAATQALEYVAATLAAVLTLLAGFGVRFVSSKIGLANSELEASLNARLNDIIHRGIDAAYMRAVAEVNDPKSGLAEVKVDNIFVGWAVEYVLKSAPEIIQKFNLQTRLREMILARLPGYLPQLAMSQPEVVVRSPVPVSGPEA